MRVFNARTHTLTDTDRRQKKGGEFKIDCISFLFFFYVPLTFLSLLPPFLPLVDSPLIRSSSSRPTVMYAPAHTHSHAQGGALSLIRDEGKKTRLLLLSALLLSSLLLLLLFLFLSLSRRAEQCSAVANARATRHEPIYYRVTLSWKFLFSLSLSLSLSPLRALCSLPLCSFARSLQRVG